MNKLTRWMILIIVSSALFLIVIDMTVLYTALPMLTYDLAATAAEKLWIVNAYPLVVAGLLPGLGTLGDRFGHKKMFITGLTIFGIASYIAAFAATPAILISGRVLLAIGAAVMMPATLSIVRITFTDENERSIAFGIWSSIAAGAGLGPVVGGILLKYFWWGSVFLINIPITIIALILALIIIPDMPGNKNRQWDLVGSILIMIGLAGLVFAIQEASRNGSSSIVIATVVLISLLSLVIFIVRQRTQPVALIDFSLFKNKKFSSGVLTAFIAFLTLAGVELAISQRLQLVLGYTPLKAGTIIIAIALASFCSGTAIGFFLPRLNVFRVQWISLLVASSGVFGLLLFFNNTLPVQIFFLIIIGLGVGCAMTVASYTVMTNAPSEKAGMAASIEEVAFEFGGAVGIAVLGGLLTALYTAFMAIPKNLNVPVIVKDSLDEALIIAEKLTAREATTLITASKTAFDQSFALVLTTGSAILLFGAIIIGIMAIKSRQVK